VRCSRHLGGVWYTVR